MKRAARAVAQARGKETHVIGRYTRPEMGRIWELENKFAIWKEIEVLACEAQAELGQAGITREGDQPRCHRLHHVHGQLH